MFNKKNIILIIIVITITLIIYLFAGVPRTRECYTSDFLNVDTNSAFYDYFYNGEN